MFETCPQKIVYKYIEKLPEMEQIYFDRWKRLEENLLLVMEWKEVDTNTIAGKGAISIRKDRKVQKLFENGFLSYQEWFKMTKDGVQVPKDVRDTESDYAYNWYTDFVTKEFVIDIKSSEGGRSEANVKSAKRQAKMYKFFTGKDIVFVVLNKKNMQVQVIDVAISSVEDLHEKAYEFRVARQEKMMFPIPGRYCKICPFQEVCKRDRFW